MSKQTRRGFLKRTPAAVVGAVIVARTGRRTVAAEDTKKTGTPANLAAALDLQANAAARFTAFAKKADEEGFTQVASLFRAAAKAEQINHDDLEAVLKKLEVTPKSGAKPVEVKSTKENLEAALKEENGDHDDRFPEFIALARKEKNKEALRVFNFCKNSQTEHISLLEDALANLEKWKGGTKTFFVCTDCGLTVAALPDDKCPSCLEPVSKFVKVA